MKIYRGKEFLKLPIGTIFCVGEKINFNSMSVKYNSFKFKNDFMFLGLNDIDWSDTSDYWTKINEIVDKNISCPLNNTIMRDGIFNEEDLFLVYEKEDLEKMMGYFKTAIEVIDGKDSSREA